MIEKCETQRLSEYLDDDLDPVVRSRLEAHLKGCAECTRLLAELRQVTRQAGAFADRTPPNDLWPGIASRIGATAPQPARPRVRSILLKRRVSVTVPQLLAAGLAALVVGGGAGAFALRGLDQIPVVGSAPVSDESVLPASFAVMAVETPYDQAIADLAALLQRDRDRLNPRTVRALEENLAIIDGAIQRAREALLQDPESDYLRDHLDRTVRQKLDLLRRANNIASRS